MVDPITAISAATAAFSLIKKGFDAGRDIESMYSDMGRWMGAVSDIRHADQMNKNPSVFKKLFNGHLSNKKRWTSLQPRRRQKRWRTNYEHMSI